MREEFINHQLESGLCEVQKSKRQNVLNRILLAFLAMFFLPLSAWAQDESYFGINTNSGSYWVTDETATDVLGDGSHKITYDATNNVLTLNGIDLSFTSDVSYTAFLALVDQDHPTITVRLVGDNTLALGNKACFFNGWGITFTTDASEPGTLTINPGDNWGGALFIYNPTSQSMNATYNNGLGLSQNGNTYTIQAPVTSYNITVAGTAVTSANASNVLNDDYSSVSYNATTNTLTLKGVHLNSTNNGISVSSDLNINLVGYSNVGTITVTSGTLNFTTSTTLPGCLKTNITGNSTITYEAGTGLSWDGTMVKTSGTNPYIIYATGCKMDGDNYCISGGDFSVKDNQGAEAALDVSTDGTVANSLNNASIDYYKVSSNSNSCYIYPASLDDMNLVNKVYFLFDWGTCTNKNVKVQVRGMNSNYGNDGTYSEEVSLPSNGGLVEIPLTGTVNSYYFQIYFSSTTGEFSFIPISVGFQKTESYGLTVGGVEVTSSNASNITGTNINGDVSYDAENHKLTLNGVELTSPISWGIDADLTIELKGTNSMNTTNGVCITSEYEREISFTGGGENCSLELSTETDDYFFSGFSNAETPTMGTGMYWIPTWNNGQMTSALITNSILGGGKGTEELPFIISSFEHLKTFAKYVNDGILSTEYIKLGGNIDCTDKTGFEPIGNNTKSFIGTFNGDGNSITGLTFSNTNPDGVSGLFGEIGSIDTNNDAITRGTVKNLTLNGCQFGNGGQNGAIAGYLHYGTIENCTVTSCTISSGNSQSTYSGGITGMVYNGIVKDCTVNGGTITSSITNSGDGYVYAGGIVAYAYSDSNINGCTVTDVSINSTGNGQNSYSGGIVGSSQATISGNSVKGTTTVNNINNDNNNAFTGAIVANETGGSLTNNYYYYTVNTQTKIGNNDPVEKSGYTQRASGTEIIMQDVTYYDIVENDGAVMYTKALTVGVNSECNFYEPLSDSSKGILALAPGQTVEIDLYPAEGTITATLLVYTPTGGTEQTVALTNIADPGYYGYSFEMPDANATLNATIVQTYDLWIGETQVTSANAANVLGNGTVSFSENVGADTGSTYKLTLNGATLTVPVKVGLDNLTIDIQGTNSITTNTTCIQKTDGDNVPSLTFTSTSDVVGSLTLKDTDEGGTNGVISSSYFGHFTINKKLALILLRSGDYTSNTYYFSAGEVHNAQLVPSYGVQVNDMQVYEGNATNVLGDNKVSFDKSSHTLTLNNVSGIEAISTTLSTLDIDLIGSNSLYRSSDGSIFESASGEAVTINLKSTGATKGSLTMEAPKSNGATLKGDNVTLTPVDPIVLLSSDVTENKGTLVYGVSYGLTVAGVTVSNVNASNVLGGATATVVFTPADNTASPATPATLTLNGADNLGTILSGLENLKVVINGDNAAVQVKANSAVSGNKNITFEGGTNGGTLAISAGDGGSVVSGFASVSYDGAYAAANVPFGYDKTASQQGYRKSHMMDDNSYLETLTITTVPHYPIWLYTNVTTSTQINNTNKNTLLGASGNVSFDGSNTLSLKNSVNCTARIVSGLSDLKISIDGDCIIESPDSGSVVRSINSSAPLTIEKASGASSASLKLAAVSFTAIKAFASLDYTGLILLSEGATYSSGALNGSKGEPLNVANFTTGLKKPTIQMNYENDTYSFNNPNEGGTLKYSRYFANNESPDEENQIDNGTTTFQIFKNGRQYNDPLTVICEVWVEANGNSSDKLYACRLDVKDMIATYGGTVPAPEFLPKAIEGVTISGYSLGDHTQVAATVTEGNITLTGAGRQELDVIFNIPNGVEYIKTSTTETPQASFFLDVKPAKPTLSKAAGTYTGTQNVTITNLTPNATAMYYTYEGEEPANPNAQEFPAGGVDISSSNTLAVYYRASYETETSMEYLYGETTKVEYIILTDPELTYKQGETSVTTATWTIDGTNNTALPVLQNTHNVAVTYESNNTAVATVANDGTVTVVGIGTATITATAAATDVSAADEAYYTLIVNRQMNVSFDATNEWATYYGTENLATPAGLKAYQVTEVNGSTVTTAEIGYIPANTAVLLQNVEGKTAAANTIASAYTGATSTFPNNLLIGSTEAVGVSSINGGTVYVLYNDMFKRATSGTIPANRAYLIVSGAAPARLNIVHGGDDTGIDNIHMDETNDNWYTIDGRKLNGQPQRAGFYIRNGKKVYKR